MQGISKIEKASKILRDRLSQESYLKNQFQELRQGILENLVEVRPSTSEGALKEISYFQGQIDLLKRLIPTETEEENNG